MTTDAWGIVDGYHDVSGGWHETPVDTRATLRAAMGGAPDEDHPPGGPPLWFVRHGTAEPLQRPCALVLEDGTALEPVTSLPPDLPLGYHDLLPDDGGPTTRLVVTPARCHLPEGLRGWLWAAQLYAMRSRASWGIGDLGDLAQLVATAATRGAWGAIVNPLHAPLPLARQEPSPYYPSSRRWRSPLYLRVEDVPGAAGDADVATAAVAGRLLNDDRHIDRDAVWQLKRAALERIWRRVWEGHESRHGFQQWRTAQGDALERYARFCALADLHGSGWNEWPDEHRHPDSADVSRFASERPSLVAFHAWLQWLLDQQLDAIAGGTVVHDLAIGVDPNGADAWMHQDVLALDVAVGAPPDEFATGGQDWGLPPFVPWRLRACGYEPYIDLLRGVLRPGGGVRIDHVMGLFRLFWIPRCASPASGTYVRSPGRELLDLLALESARAEALVIGEDLGTVEPEVRAALGDAGVLSYRLAWFEQEPPESYPEQALAAVTTHDLPTVAGVWTGADGDELRALGRDADAAASDGLRTRLRDLAGAEDDADAAAVTVRLHARLARAPSMLVAATLEDAVGAVARPNVPGTTDERANWSFALPRPLEELLEDEFLRAIEVALNR